MLIHAHLKKTPYRVQIGFSLIEVLVSIVILSLGLLGLAGLFNYSISSSKNANSRMAAALLVADFAEMVRANPDGFDPNIATSKYDRLIPSFNPNDSSFIDLRTDVCTFPNCSNSTVATSSLAKNDMDRFRNRVRTSLPAGDMQATRVGNTNQIDVWIVWAEGKGTNSNEPEINNPDPEANSDNCPTSISLQNPPPNPYPRCLYTRVAL